MTRRIFCKVLLVVVAIFGLLVLSGVLSAQGRSEDAFDRVREVQERNTDWLMAIDGVEGTAIGFNPNARLALKVFTAGPGVAGIPQTLDGVPVQVVVTGKFYAIAPPDGRGPPEGKGPKGPKDEVDPTARFDRPVPIGVSTGHPDITAGTIACRVTDGIDVYALSNNHVYANQNKASIGDNVLQPGPADGGQDPADAIGTLFDFEPIVFLTGFEPEPTNTIDAAIALSSTILLDNATPSDGYGMPSSTTVAPKLAPTQYVQKYGRTSSLTKGIVTDINFTGNIGYSSGTARFVGQIVVYSSKKPFIKPGDSGSLLVTQDDNSPVGLLFAGNPSGKYAIANPIGAVLTRFGVTVDGTSP